MPFWGSKSQSPFGYLPSEHPCVAWELSGETIPFLLFNLSVRGMDAVVCHGDSLVRGIKSAYLVWNPQDDHMAFSDVTRFAGISEMLAYMDNA